jgi:hypothetical protein
VVTGLSLSGGLLILIIGLPCRAFPSLCQGIGLVEGFSSKRCSVSDAPAPAIFPKKLGWWQRFKDL